MSRKMLNDEMTMEEDKDVLSIYLKEINRVPLLDHDEEYSLAVRAQKGDENCALLSQSRKSTRARDFPWKI